MDGQSEGAGAPAIDPRRLATPSGVAAVLEQYGLAPNKALGQNFLVDGNVLRRIVAAAELTAADTVLEIGPGLGVVTAHAARTARHVVAIEVDKGLFRWLTTFLGPYDNVHLVHEDALKTDLAGLLAAHRPAPGGAYKVLANLPYYITTPLLMRLLEENLPIDSAVVMVQREVARRLGAVPATKDYGALSVAVQLRADVETVADVSPGVFFPRPQVQSSVVRLRLKPLPPEAPPESLLFAVVRAAFGQRRKTLRNALRHAAASGRHRSPADVVAWTKDDVDAALAAAEVDGRRRGETLSPADFVTLAAGFARIVPTD